MPENKPNLYVTLAMICLLVLGTAACGPSEREIEATVEARVQARETSATATAIANLPTPTPVITSDAGLMLPTRIRVQPFSVQVMSVDEARAMYRDIGCSQCSTTLADMSRRPYPSEPNYPGMEVMVGHFLGNDELPDAVHFRYSIDIDADRFELRATLLRHSGVNLDKTEGYQYLANRFYGEGLIGDNIYRQIAVHGADIVNGRVFDVDTTIIHEDIYLFVLAILGGEENRPENNFDFLRSSRKNNEVTSTYSDDFWAEEHRGFISEYWLGDFDDDNEVEVATIKDGGIHRVIEIVEGITHSSGATATISLATRDFASNLLTDDAEDFELLWREHGPSASVAALALILDMPFHDLLDRLYQAVDNGEDIREAVLAIRQSRN